MKKGTKSDADPQVDEKRAVNIAEAMINAAKDEADELSEKVALQIKNPELAKIVRSYYRQGYIKGVMSIIQKEIYDRISDEITTAHKERHKKDLQLRVATPGTSKPKKQKAKA